MVNEWIFDVVMYLNAFMDQGGVSNELPPNKTVPVEVKLEYDIRKLIPGSYHQV